ncbi:MAG: outer membrane beta-barrel protein [Pseudomonadota bacterium]
MKKMIQILALSAMSLCTCAYADNQFYIGLGAGYAGAEDMPQGDTFANVDGVTSQGDSSETASNYGGRIAVGYLWDTQTDFAYGLETAAAYYGVTKYSNDAASVEMNYYGLELLGVGELSFDKLRLIGKAGISDEQFHPTKKNIENNPNFTSSQQVLPEVGAGLAYSFTQDLQVGITYYHTFGTQVSFNSDGDATKLPSVDLVLLEMAYFL